MTPDYEQRSRLIRAILEGSVPKSEINETIARSWKRCLSEYSLDPEAHRAPQFVDLSDLQQRRARNPLLISIAEVEMVNLQKQLIGADHVLALADPEGVILHTLDSNNIGLRYGLAPGAVWGEAMQGTNAVGTALLEGRGLLVHREEHFLRANTMLTCAAVPIRDHLGNMVGILDATSTSEHAQQHTISLVRLSVHTIENLLFLAASSNECILRFHSRPEFITTVYEGLVSFDEYGTILSYNSRALFHLGLSSRDQLLGKSIEDVFNATLEDVVQRADVNPYAIFELRHESKDLYALARCNQRAPRARQRPWTPPGKTISEGIVSLHEFAAGDPTIEAYVEQVQRLFDAGVPFVLYGETGTGKGVFAKALHYASPRKGQPFVAINCAAIPESLIESELFGYKRGAFTGADRHGKRGKILQANEGTLFLDEIGDMALSLQARLLRVLEEKEVIPLGGETPVPVDIQIMTATHQNLAELVSEGRFREDLFYRIHGATFILPPLRERRNKRELISGLFRKYANRPIDIAEDVLDAMCRYTWPGNIRECCTVIRMMAALADHDKVTMALLPPSLMDKSRQDTKTAGMTDNALTVAERQALISVLDRLHWNVSAAAKELGMSRATLYRKMKRYGIKARV